jgi:digeranylgeranylglycerophospholipid reductase
LKAAVIGAGLAGLACGLTLEKEGIPFDIFERRSMSGELFHHSSAMLQIMNRPIKDPLKHLYDQYGLDITPLAPIKRIVMKTPHRESTVRGKLLGYFFKRGQEGDTIEQQLAKQLKTSVQFNIHADWRELSAQYDHVVVCDGVGRVTKELGCWTDTFRSWVKGATILGEFDPHTLIMWINTNFCKAGYAYMTPFNRNRAFIGLVVPNCDQQELDYYWEMFMRLENINNEIAETFEVHHSAGHVFPHQVGNIRLAGLAGGFQDPFLGFGQFNSLSTGALAALSISRGLDYESLVSTIATEIRNMSRYRDMLDTVTNPQYDALVKVLGLPGLNQLIYNTNINVLKSGGQIINLMTGLSRKLKSTKS